MLGHYFLGYLSKTLKQAIVSFIMSLCYCIRKLAAKILLTLANVQLLSFLISWEIFLQTPSSRLQILSCRLTYCKDLCPNITEGPFPKCVHCITLSVFAVRGYI